MKLYNWNTVEPEQLNPRIGRQCIHGSQMTIARLHLQKDAVVPEHSHVNEQVSMVERGALKFLLEGREQIVRAGDVLVIPPHAPHSVEVLEDSTVVDVFSPPREDWIRGDDAYLRR
ncbi:MAG TPA: cupin domain-containing protein [Bryobacteraceae bacterium]|nr:cupin domain-containing protein [Bryobacteraceae bacterium]